MKTDIKKLVRKNILELQPYSSARSEFTGNEGVFIDANENPFGNEGYNRYPDPLQRELRQKLSSLKKIGGEKIFIGNGSDEAIDLMIRSFCEPAADSIIICPPTYGMYEVCAGINDVNVISVPLTEEEFQLDVPEILRSITANTKLIFICCPNNPTGNGVKWRDIQIILQSFSGLVVLDEAYIDFASYRSLIPELTNYDNLVILQTLSKAWGLAGLRLGLAFASEEIIAILNKVKAPYNVNYASQKIALNYLQNSEEFERNLALIKNEKEKLKRELEVMSVVERVYPSEANFFLVKVNDANNIYKYLIGKKIIIRNRSGVQLCRNCIRITVGTPEENNSLINALKEYEKSIVY